MTKEHIDTEPNKDLIVGQHYPEIDGLRAIAVLMVLYFHSSLIIGKPEDAILASYFEFTMVGWAGVDLFFVISGFLISGILMDTAYRKNCFRNFYIRRTVRIFPLYYAALILGFSAIYLVYSTEFYSRDLLYFLYLQNWFKMMGYNHVIFFSHFWSLAVEEQFYLFWPAIFVFAFRRSFAVPLCLFLIAFAVLLRWYLGAIGENEIAYTITITRVDGLVLGALLAYVLKHKKDAHELAPLFVMTMALNFVAICVLAFVNGGLFGQDQLVIMYGLFFFALFFTALLGWVAIAPKEHIFQRFLRLGVMQTIGRVSYGLYVYHWLIMCVLIQHPFFDDLAYVVGHPVMLVIGGVLSFVLAWLSFRYFEQPLLRLKHIYARYEQEEKRSS